jgi:hypothetical protein
VLTIPGATVDRQFTFTLHRLCRVAAVVRVVYPDLVADLKAVEVLEAVAFLPPAATAGSGALSGGEEEGEDAVRKSKYRDSDVATVAHIDCIPIRIPLGK